MEISKDGYKLLAIFVLIATLWIFGDYLSKIFNIKYFDSVVSILGVILLFAFNLVNVKDFKKVDWGTLILFGGALCLGGIVIESGANVLLGEKIIALLGDFNYILILILLTAMTVILTNFISNTGLTGILIPILLGASLNIPKEILILAVGISASCSFILPVGTPPNAIVYGEGVKKEEMMKVGTILSMISVVIIVLYFSILSSI